MHAQVILWSIQLTGHDSERHISVGIMFFSWQCISEGEKNWTGNWRIVWGIRLAKGIKKFTQIWRSGFQDPQEYIHEQTLPFLQFLKTHFKETQGGSLACWRIGDTVYDKCRGEGKCREVRSILITHQNFSFICYEITEISIHFWVAVHNIGFKGGAVGCNQLNHT